ncbi:1230_t:CDS:2 [Ambispora gerdemannii]|uniref:1230_t:CDS:1 n=1 Tax=Ambispora gerdemannii TaxID=144530 RepID=A0A9N9C2E5_9GLOM|nr:1230_t:CDS:2 [Ambispora gerdemannii]
MEPTVTTLAEEGVTQEIKMTEIEVNDETNLVDAIQEIKLTLTILPELKQAMALLPEIKANLTAIPELQEKFAKLSKTVASISPYHFIGNGVVTNNDTTSTNQQQQDVAVTQLDDASSTSAVVKTNEDSVTVSNNNSAPQSKDASPKKTEESTSSVNVPEAPAQSQKQNQLAKKNAGKTAKTQQQSQQEITPTSGSAVQRFNNRGFGRGFGRGFSRGFGRGMNRGFRGSGFQRGGSRGFRFQANRNAGGMKNNRILLQENWNQSVSTFETMNLKQQLLDGIREHGWYNEPSPIQQRAIPAIFSGRNVIIQIPCIEQRVMCFVIALLQEIDPEDPLCQAIILIPTKDIGHFVAEILNSVGRFLRLGVVTCTPETTLDEDLSIISNIDRSKQIIIATPGRMLSLIRTREWFGGHIKSIVVEECCLMFSRQHGYKTFDILRSFPRIKRVLMTTATTYTLAELKDREAPNAAIVLDESGFKDGLHLYFKIVNNEEQKLSAVCETIEALEIEKAVIFCRNSDTVNSLADKLHDMYHDYPVWSIDYDTPDEQRWEILNKFFDTNEGMIVVVGTHSSSLTFSPSPFVINYDLPPRKEPYHDRAICCGGYGREGTMINILTKTSMLDLAPLERYYHVQSEQLMPPAARAEIEGVVTKTE